MRIHTKLSLTKTTDALLKMKQAGVIDDGMMFLEFDRHGSRSRAHAFEVKIGAYPGDVEDSHPTRQVHGGYYIAPTYDEWGWFLAAVFAADPEAKAGPYTSEKDFQKQTRYRFVAPDFWQTAGSPGYDPYPIKYTNRRGQEQRLSWQEWENQRAYFTPKEQDSATSAPRNFQLAA